MSTTVQPSLEETLGTLRAAAEETRLRILALLAEGELSVSDLTDILGQSQPRISRHLKLLVEAGLVERHREGAWAFFRLADNAAGAMLRPVLHGVDSGDRRVAADRERLAAVRAQRAETALSHFARIAPEWDRLRSLHVPEEAVEAAILEALGAKPIRSLVDLGTGTGRMLQLLAPRASRVVGLDASHAMLSAVVYLTLGALLARTEPRRRAKLYFLAVAVFLSVLVGASRVYLGVHWPTDVLAGWTVGAGWALLCWLATLWLQRRGKVEAEDDHPPE